MLIIIDFHKKKQREIKFEEEEDEEDCISGKNQTNKQTTSNYLSCIKIKDWKNTICSAKQGENISTLPTLNCLLKKFRKKLCCYIVFVE